MLALSFLLSEGVIRTLSEVRLIRHCASPEHGLEEPNVLEIELEAEAAARYRRASAGVKARTLDVRTSCGLCGVRTLEEVARDLVPLPEGPAFARAALEGLDGQLRAAQSVFVATGGTHACGLFDHHGSLKVAREDVGRHNALDKALGRSLLAGWPRGQLAAMLSGRCSFEMAAKCARAGVPLVISVSAPTSLAVAACQRLGVGLICFLRANSYRVFAHPERLA
jgi:FdhD protein